MERLAIQLAADATAQGDEVAVAAGPGEWLPRVRDAGASYVPLRATSRWAVAGMAAVAADLAAAMRRLRPEVVHSHNVRAAVLARLALTAARHQAALLPTVHGLAPHDYGTASRVLRLCAPRVVACAPAVARSLAAAGFPRRRIDVITNGAALSPAPPERQAALRESLRLAGTPFVAGVGRLVPQKDWPLFIAAAAAVPSVPWVVAGDGPLRAELSGRAAAAGGTVRFVGEVDDIAALLGQAACLVSTSCWEGLPLALLEALSLGVPVVATAVDGVTDVVPPSAALLVPPHDPGAVAAAVSRVLADGPLTARLRQGALAAAPAWAPGLMSARYRAAYRAAAAGEPCWVSG
jgi:glycosyltransferase involved in cell wall biosynthesis